MSWGTGDSGCCAGGTSTYQEGAEHGDGGEEMPDVVVVKEVEQDAVTVVLPGFSWRFLPGTGPVSLCLPMATLPTPLPVPPSCSPARC